MIGKGLIFYIGCALIPSPPSPCPDFGLQPIMVILIGLAAPRAIVRPIYLFFRFSGRSIKHVWGKLPLIGPVIMKIDELLKKWENFMVKKRHSENIVLKKIYSVFLRKDLIERIIFGYFVTIIIGSILMILALSL